MPEHDTRAWHYRAAPGFAAAFLSPEAARPGATSRYGDRPTDRRRRAVGTQSEVSRRPPARRLEPRTGQVPLPSVLLRGARRGAQLTPALVAVDTGPADKTASTASGGGGGPAKISAMGERAPKVPQGRERDPTRSRARVREGGDGRSGRARTRAFRCSPARWSAAYAECEWPAIPGALIAWRCVRRRHRRLPRIVPAPPDA